MMKKGGFKNSTYLFSALLMLTLCFGFVSCGDDDGEGISGNANEQIVGEWQSTWDTGYEIYKGEKDEWDEAYVNLFLVFKDGGKGTLKDREEDSADPFTWKISGNKLIIDMYDEPETFTILKLNAKEMVLEGHTKDSNEEFYQKLTFKRR